MTQIAIRDAIDPPWTNLLPVRVGAIPDGLGTPDIYVTVEIDGKPSLRVDVYADVECFAFEEALIWKEFLVIGLGSRLHLIRLADNKPTSIEFDDYFGHLYPQEDSLVVTSGSRIWRITSDGEIMWTSERVGLDGVVIAQVKDGVIYSEGEWDPPGGWRPFRVCSDSGTVMYSAKTSV
jgi:hypothetical protein